MSPKTSSSGFDPTNGNLNSIKGSYRYNNRQTYKKFNYRTFVNSNSSPRLNFAAKLL